MSPECTQRLDWLGRVLNRWEAQVRGAWWLAATLGWLTMLSLLDILVQVGRAGRMFSSLGMLVLLGLAGWQVVRALRRAFSREGVAARVERTFPELDNHLINYLQFSRERSSNPFIQAYVGRGEPAWQGLDFQRMKDVRAHRRSGGIRFSMSRSRAEESRSPTGAWCASRASKAASRTSKDASSSASTAWWRATGPSSSWSATRFNRS